MSGQRAGVMSLEDEAALANTILQVDGTGAGFADDAVDPTDCFLVLHGVTPTGRDGFLLTDRSTVTFLSR